MTCRRPVRLLENFGEMLVPCGRCYLCKVNIAREWAVRLEHESRYYESSCFITLTFDDDHLPDRYSVRKRDVQLYLKRMRKDISPVKIRYFGIGDYGDELYRPHYHLIIFGWEPSLADLQESSRKSGRVYYSSGCVSRWWPFGYNTVGTVTGKSCTYVTRYLLAKSNDKLPDQLPRFRMMSKGLGLKYALEHSDEIKRDLVCKTAGKPVGLPLYYRRKLEIPTEDMHMRSMAVSAAYNAKIALLGIDNEDGYDYFLEQMRQKELNHIGVLSHGKKN